MKSQRFFSDHCFGDFSAISAVKLAILRVAIRKRGNFSAIAIFWDSKHSKAAEAQSLWGGLHKVFSSREFCNDEAMKGRPINNSCESPFRAARLQNETATETF